MKNVFAGSLCFMTLMANEVAFAATSAAPIIDVSKVNTFKAAACLVILLVAFILFFTEKLPIAVTSMLIPAALAFPGIDILKGNRAYSNFGQNWVVTFLAVFILGEAIFRTGLATKIGNFAVTFAGKENPRRFILVVGTVIAFVSAFLSNSAVMAMFVPILVASAKTSRLGISVVALPMAFMIEVGGNLTLIGAASKGVVNGLMETYKIRPFGFFEFTPIGLVMMVIALIYFAFIGYKLIPERTPSAEGSAMMGGKFDESQMRWEKMPVATVIFVAVIAAMVTGFLKPPVAAMLGAMLCVITKCISIKEAYAAVNWNTIFLFAGTLALGDALIATGADKLLAKYLVSYITTPYVLLVVVLVLVCLVSNFMSNTAAASVTTPIAIACASAFNVNPLPFCMAVAAGCSWSFLTPIASPTNTIAYTLGGYKFSDFAKVGGILQIVMVVAGAILIPVFFPF